MKAEARRREVPALGGMGSWNDTWKGCFFWFLMIFWGSKSIAKMVKSKLGIPNKKHKKNTHEKREVSRSPIAFLSSPVMSADSAEATDTYDQSLCDCDPFEMSGAMSLVHMHRTCHRTKAMESQTCFQNMTSK